MFQIPQCVLENLKCALCDGYLNIKPLMIKPDGEQICGNCTEIIPIEEKEKCLRQIGLETLAQLFVFPCRYHRQGCKHRFAWNTDNSHEEICPYRYRTSLSSMPSRSSREFDHYNVQQGHVSDLNGMISDFTYDFKNDDSGPAVPPYENARKYQNDNDLLAADTSIQRLTGLVYDEATNNIVEENMYEALGNKSARQCSTCKAVVDDDVYTCLFGHLSCINCKRNMCKMCVNLLEKDSKNYLQELQ
ncbi:hypothetical protein NQ317_013141 [Molorchus minor]|uniref:RING-type domain-containing protein n=1 Tax=Molorchus minor TaxID=1323400 RepID=A0ABQ9JJE2_9CUCU|nr:hypothetical protein NQ317_013141 [Molorchus minor]